MKTPGKPKKKRIKRSGRTIAIVGLGLLIYTLFIAWYDGSPLSPGEIQGLKLEGVPENFQMSIQRLVKEQHTADLFLVVRSNKGGDGPWTHSSHCEPLIKMQLQNSLGEAYPKNDFKVYHFRNLKDLIVNLNTAGPIEGTILPGDQFWFDCKLLVALVLGGLLLLVVKKMDKPVSS